MILLIGFPKSGTTSFQHLFLELGYNSYHWTKGDNYIGTMIKNNKEKNKLLLNDFLETDVITQMDVCINNYDCYWPQLTDYKQLYYENPNSIFILNKRNPEKILQSFKNWHNFYERIFNYNPELFFDKTENGFINFIINHYNNIETFFLQHPDSKFITYDIENDSIEKLKKYIDIKEIKFFPKLNENKL